MMGNSHTIQDLSVLMFGPYIINLNSPGLGEGGEEVIRMTATSGVENINGGGGGGGKRKNGGV